MPPLRRTARTPRSNDACGGSVTAGAPIVSEREASLFSCCCTDGGGMSVEKLNIHSTSQLVLGEEQSSHRGEALAEQSWKQEGYHFNIHLSKCDNAEMLGMILKTDELRSELVIEEPNGRALNDWNALHPDVQVATADQIVAVNAASGSADALVEEIRKAQCLDIVIYRLKTHTISLIQKGPIGALVNQEDMTIAAILEHSMLYDHNSWCLPSCEILIGSKILNVNGTSDPKSMMEHLCHVEDGRLFMITVQRPATISTKFQA